MKSPIEIRTEEPGQMSTRIEIVNAGLPESAHSTVEEAAIWDSMHVPDDPPFRLLAWDEAEAVGAGYAGRTVFSQEGQYSLEVAVLPDHRKRGLGRQLYGVILKHAEAHHASAVSCSVNVTNLEFVKEFLEAEGFVEVERLRPSELQVSGVNLDDWRQTIERVETGGIRLSTLADDESDSTIENLWQVGETVVRDIPGEPPPPMSLDLFRDLIARPEIRHDCFVLGWKDDHIAGFSMLVHQTSTKALTGMTGVLPEYRNQGIAMALKVRSVETAKAAGYSAMRTYNHVDNPSMLAVNDRLGYVELPHVLVFKKVLAIGTHL